LADEKVMGLSTQKLAFKRKFPRRRFRRSIGFLYNGDYFVGMGAEIGEGGLAFLLPRDFPMDTEGVVSFQIPDGSFICVRVEIKNEQVQSSGETLIGCSYKNLKFEHKREIRSYVSARSENE
jgi:hypothetical protein